MEPYILAKGNGEKLIFPGAIALEILVPGTSTNGMLAVFEDIVEPGIGNPVTTVSFAT
jgi:hypothetical protein